jgi:hypothetical protein
VEGDWGSVEEEEEEEEEEAGDPVANREEAATGRG